MPGWWNKKKENALNEELQVHLDMVVRERTEGGEDKEETNRSAHREFGNVPLIQRINQRRLEWPIPFTGAARKSASV